MLQSILFFMGTAQAEAGLVVRLTGDVEGTVIKTQFVTADGSLREILLNDRGSTPDVEAEDGIFAGATMLPDGKQEVKLVIDDKVLEGGSIELVSDGLPRDLNLVLKSDELSAELVVGGGSQEPVMDITSAKEGSDGNAPIDGISLAEGPPLEGDMGQRIQEGPTNVDVPVPEQNAPVGEEIEAVPSANPVASQPTNVQPALSQPSVSNNSSSSSSSAQSSDDLMLFMGGGFLIFIAGLLYLNQRISLANVDLSDLKRLTGAPVWSGKKLTFQPKVQKIFVTSEQKKSFLPEFLEELGRNNVVLICGEIPKVNPPGGPFYAVESSSGVEVGDKLDRLRRQYGDGVVVVNLAAKANKDFSESLPKETVGFWLIQSAGGAEFKLSGAPGNWAFSGGGKPSKDSEKKDLEKKDSEKKTPPPKSNT